MDSPPRRAPGASPALNVVVGVKNDAQALQRCLDGIASQSEDSREVIVVHSAATDGTLRRQRVLKDHTYARWVAPLDEITEQELQRAKA